ncbi:MAG: hypothetical protein ACK5LN_10880 [Propioniciclava sp.]
MPPPPSERLGSHRARPQHPMIEQISLTAAVVGLVSSCIPGALILGWILLAVALILVGYLLLFARSRTWLVTAAVFVSAAGIVVALVVYSVFVVDRQAGPLDPVGTTGTPAVSAEPDDTTTVEVPPADLGSLASPIPLGTTVTLGDWEVTVLQGPEGLARRPRPGQKYIVMELRVTYMGSLEEPPWGITVAYIDQFGDIGGGSWASIPNSYLSIQSSIEGNSLTETVGLPVSEYGAEKGMLFVQIERHQARFAVQ